MVISSKPSGMVTLASAGARAPTPGGVGDAAEAVDQSGEIKGLHGDPPQ
jgi:hypothetical protein